MLKVDKREIGQHLCYQGEYETSCKYLDIKNCPAKKNEIVKIKAINDKTAVEYTDEKIISVVDSSVNRKGDEWKLCSRCNELKIMIMYDGKDKDYCEECMEKVLKEEVLKSET